MHRNVDSLYPKSLRRVAPIPKSAREQFERITTAIGRVASDEIVWSFVSSLDWTSSHIWFADRHHIKIDWSLIEFVSSVQTAVSRSNNNIKHKSCDCLGDVPFAGLDVVQNMIVGETFRFLCWKSIQSNHWDATAFFFDRFMEYFASSRENMMSYLSTDQRGNRRFADAISLAVGHELGHMDTHRTDGTLDQNSQSLRNTLEMMKNMPPRFAYWLSEGRLDHEECVRFIDSERNTAFLAELACDGAAFATLLLDILLDVIANRPIEAVELVDHMTDYAIFIRLQSWLNMLEFFLFSDESETLDQDGAEKGSSKMRDLVEFNNIRIYLWTSFNIAECIEATSNASLLKIDLEACLTYVRRELYKIDRPLTDLMESVISWRFQIKKMRKTPLFLQPEHSIILAAMKRYPAFEKADYELATKIADWRRRG